MQLVPVASTSFSGKFQSTMTLLPSDGPSSHGDTPKISIDYRLMSLP